MYSLLYKKKRAFKSGDTYEGSSKSSGKRPKTPTERKVEQMLQQNNKKEAWNGMKTITGCSSKWGTLWNGMWGGPTS